MFSSLGRFTLAQSIIAALIFAPSGAAAIPAAIHAPAGLDREIVRGELGRALDDYLRAATTLGYSGVALVAVKGQVVLHKAYGFADREKRIPFRLDTPIAVHSIDKNFTAAAILKLEEEGKLRISDPVSKYIPDWPADKAGITIHHLLTHTSGLPTYGGPDEEPVSRAELLKRMREAKLEFEPGTKWSYSNPGYGLLAAIVEDVSGRPFDAFLQQKLFKPAGVRIWYPSAQGAANAYCSYFPFNPSCLPLPSTLIADGPTWTVRGNSGHRTTVANLYRWSLALKRGVPISLASQAKAMTGYIDTPLEGAAGYGWFVSETPGRGKEVSHTGGDGFVGADFERYLDRDVVITGFSDMAGGFRTMFSQVAKIALGEAASPFPPASERLPAGELKALAGTYRLPDGQVLDVRAEGGHLSIPFSWNAIPSLWQKPRAGLEPAMVADAEAKALTILQAFDRSDYEPLRASLSDPARFEEEKASWTEYWLRVAPTAGRIESVRAIGAAMSKAPDGGSSVPEVELLVRSSHGMQYLKASRTRNGSWQLQLPPPGRIPPEQWVFLPTSSTEFLGYGPSIRQTAHLSFQRGPDGTLNLIFTGDNGLETTATRV